MYWIWRKRMVRNVSTYVGSVHVLDSKLVSQFVKKIVIVINVIPNLIKISLNTNWILNTVNSISGSIRIANTCQIGRYIQVRTAFLTNKHRKNTHKTIEQFLCLIKDWLTHKKNQLKNKIQFREFPACRKNFRICLYTSSPCLYNVITLLRQFVSIYSSSSSFD